MFSNNLLLFIFCIYLLLLIINKGLNMTFDYHIFARIKLFIPTLYLFFNVFTKRFIIYIAFTLLLGFSLCIKYCYYNYAIKVLTCIFTVIYILHIYNLYLQCTSIMCSIYLCLKHVKM